MLIDLVALGAPLEHEAVGLAIYEVEAFFNSFGCEGLGDDELAIGLDDLITEALDELHGTIIISKP